MYGLGLFVGFRVWSVGLRLGGLGLGVSGFGSRV